MSGKTDQGRSWAPGEIVAGKYRIERLLGAGGMGKVYAAYDQSLDRKVALKFLLVPDLSGELRARFLREARAIGRLNSEQVPRTYEVGELQTGEPFLAIEFLTGHDLADELKLQGGAVPVGQAVDWVLEACLGVAEAHALGMVHRDLKPPNLFLTARRDGTQVVKVLDFGISKSASELDPTLTAEAAMMGSPYYMSPEQFRSARDVDHRTDIWALGAILQELTSGQVPFDGDTMIGLYDAVSHNEPRELASPLGELPPAFKAVVRRCLSKEPDARYANLAELAAALEPFAEHQKEASTKIARILGLGEPQALGYAATSLAPPAKTDQPQTAGAWSFRGSEARSKALPRRLGLWALGVSLPLALGAVVLQNRAEPPRPVPSAATALPSAPAVPAATPLTATSLSYAEPTPSASASSKPATTKPSTNRKLVATATALPTSLPSAVPVTKSVYERRK